MESRDLQAGLLKSLLEEARNDLREQPGYNIRNTTLLNADAMKSIENKTYLAYYPTSPLGENSITQMLELMSFIGLPHKNAMVILFAGMYGFFEVPFPEMPTSGDLKSGDSISCTYSGFHELQETTGN